MDQQILRSFIQETLYEGRRTQSKRLHTLTNTVTADIMRLIHQKSTKLHSVPIDRNQYQNFEPETGTAELYELIAGPMPLTMDWEGYLDDDDDPDDYDVDTVIRVFIEIDRNSDRLNISGGDKDPTGEVDLGFTVVVELPPDTPKSEYGKIRDQVANSVRHEIEHVTQGAASTQDFLAFNRGNKYFEFLHGPKEAETSWGKYLLKPEEIPAFVRGEAHNVKNYEQLLASIEKFLTGYLQKELITEYEKQIVADTWLDWAQKHINTKGFTARQS